MRLAAIRIPCNDLAESGLFYEQQIGLEKSFGSSKEGYIGFNLDGVTLLLEPAEQGEYESGKYLGFSIEVDNVFDFYNTLSARGVEFTHAPEAQTWGAMMTHIRDCSGNVLTIVERTSKA